MNSKLLVLLTNPDVADLCSELGLQARPEHVSYYVWDAYVKRCSFFVRCQKFWLSDVARTLPVDFDTLRALPASFSDIDVVFTSCDVRPHYLSVSQMRSDTVSLRPFVSPELF